jgi:hypothetical protein
MQTGLSSAIQFLDRERLKRNAPGLAVSALLHALAALLLLFIIRHPSQVAETATHILPVDIVHLGADTESPAAEHKSVVPKEASPRPGQSSSLSPAGISHDKTKPLPEDAFDAKLHALAQLRQPNAKLQPLENTGTDDETAGQATGNHASYSLRDFVRAQVLRHWNLDYSVLGDRRFTVPVRVEMTSRGVIASAKIMDQAKYAEDAIYREIALSARNAVLLSSPIPLPPGNYQAVMNFVLDLNPRDTNR